MIAVSVFFCSILYKPLNVNAAASIMSIEEFVRNVVLPYVGYKLADAAWDKVGQKLGWKQADIQVDENGNVIISEAQMQELKDAINEYTQDENGNDKYGMYLYEPTGRVPAYAEWDSGYADYKGLAGEDDYWFNYSGNGIAANRGYFLTVAPGDCFFIGDSSYVTFASYDEGTGQLIGLEAASYQNGTYREDVTRSPNQSVYCGNPHMAFLSEQGAQAWASDGCPYTMAAPTYTGGSLTIPKDQLTPDTDPDSGEDFDDDGNPTTEKGWLQRIYERLGDILDQVKQIKWITVVDTVIDAIDTFGEDAKAAVTGVAEALTGVLSEIFPLCFIWDIFLVIDMFDADPVDPVFTINLDFSALGISDEPYELVIDLTEYDTIFQIIRVFEVLFFMLGLWNLTYDWIVGKGDKV